MRIDRWWNEGRVSYHEHASHEAHHKLTFHHARSIHMDFNSSNSSDVVIPALNSKSTPIRLPEHSIKATPSPTPGHSKAPTPAKKSSTSTKAKHMTHADRVRAGKELEHKMREQEKKIDFYRKSIVKTKQEIDNLKKLRDDSAKQILELKERDSYEMEELKKTEIEMRQLMVEKKRLGYPGWGWIELVSAVITDKA
ncbi:hypothetical protein N431DRAFT_432626 [Stipitochalara longipes BDJ]|nr:hypothetical protein N431DRAFT_432626 [Stipitochalara longipes BDJ]